MIAAADHDDDAKKFTKKGLRKTTGLRIYAFDCDFYTFFPSCRHVLDDEIYVCDWPATEVILDKIFRYFVVDELIHRRLGLKSKRYVSGYRLADEISRCLDLQADAAFEFDTESSTYIWAE